MRSRWGLRFKAWRADVGRILPLAWPVLIGQIAVLMFGTVDTVLVARYSATDLAAFAVGSAAYITVFIGLMGVVMAVSPIVGQLYGAKRYEAAGEQLHQALWAAIALAAVGSTLLLFPQPFLALSRATPEVAAKVRGYLTALALGLPASLLFTAYRGFNTAVSRPKAVMALQLAGLAVKVPLSVLLVYGAGPVPSLGVVGCAIATAVTMWLQALLAWRVMCSDAFYAPFALFGRGLHAPNRAALAALVKLGVPMGASVTIEVVGFASMAFFISRIGTNAVAGHRIAADLVSLMFMLPLSLSSASSTLVAQSIGAQRLRDAQRIGWHGLQFTALAALVLGTLVFFAREGVVRLYTNNEVIVAAALPLLALLPLFHFVDAVQIGAAFVFRAWRVVMLPLVIYAVSIFGLGLGGGYVLAFNVIGDVPAVLQGARGFWIASTAGLGAAALGLTFLLAWVLRQQSLRSP